MISVSNQLKLRVFWLKDALGLAIDQTFLDQVYPLTQYYFWPRTEAWEQLQLDLDTKTWLSENEKLVILNIATDVIEHWRNYRNRSNLEGFTRNFNDTTIVGVSN